jgi:hypothetical protein
MVYTNLPPSERLIVIGDIHGDISRLCSCLYMAKIINRNLEWIAEPANTVVVQMGDQLDSLSRNLETPEWEQIGDCTLLDFTDKLDIIAKNKGGRFISMIGNHELMNVLGSFEYVSKFSLDKSGGFKNRHRMFSPGGKYAEILAKRPVVQKIGRLLFCHAGLLPSHIQAVNNNLSNINNLFIRFVKYGCQNEKDADLCNTLFVNDDSILWNRTYIKDINPSKEDLLNTVLNLTNTKHMFIGHNALDEILHLYNLKLWNTDVGLSRAFSRNSIQVLEILNDGVPSIKNEFKPFRIIKSNIPDGSI